MTAPYIRRRCNSFGVPLILLSYSLQLSVILITGLLSDFYWKLLTDNDELYLKLLFVNDLFSFSQIIIRIFPSEVSSLSAKLEPRVWKNRLV
jgi:hypothetical protein